MYFQDYWKSLISEIHTPRDSWKKEMKSFSSVFFVLIIHGCLSFCTLSDVICCRKWLSSSFPKIQIFDCFIVILWIMVVFFLVGIYLSGLSR